MGAANLPLLALDSTYRPTRWLNCTVDYHLEYKGGSAILNVRLIRIHCASCMDLMPLHNVHNAATRNGAACAAPFLVQAPISSQGLLIGACSHQIKSACIDSWYLSLMVAPLHPMSHSQPSRLACIPRKPAPQTALACW